MQTLLLALILAQPPAVPGHVSAPPMVMSDPAPKFSTWNAASQIDKGERKRPVVVFVGVPAREIPGAIVASEKMFPDCKGTAVVLGIWENGDYTRYDLSCTADDFAIWNKYYEAMKARPNMGRKEVSLTANPFDKSFQRQESPVVQRDDKRHSAGLRYNGSHNCPSCGTQQLRISGSGPVAGTHIHTCPKCGLSWYH